MGRIVHCIASKLQKSKFSNLVRRLYKCAGCHGTITFEDALKALLRALLMCSLKWDLVTLSTNGS